MAKSLNRTVLLGHLGKDPETKTFANGGSVTNVTLATSERWKDKDGQPAERTDWHNLVFHDKLGEIAAKYLKKGSRLYVEGRLRTRSYEGKDGADRYITEIHVDDMNMLDSKPATKPASGSGTPAPAAAGSGFEDDDIPF